MASEEPTPAVSDAAKSGSPTKTSTASTDKKEGDKPLFTPKEQNLLNVAMMHCLKSGPPEIDYEKFKEHGDFNTMKTAQNTWGKIKAKLKQAAPAKKDDGEDGGEGDATPKTPMKATPKKATPKKRAKKGDDDGADAGEAEATPKKKRSPVKKTPKKKVEEVEEDAEDAEVDVKMEEDGD